MEVASDKDLLRQTRDLLIETATRTKRIEKDLFDLGERVHELSNFKVRAVTVASFIGTGVGAAFALASSWFVKQLPPH